MLIDSDTARNLELVGNMSVRKSAHSLFGYVYVSSLSSGLVVTPMYAQPIEPYLYDHGRKAVEGQYFGPYHWSVSCNDIRRIKG